MNKIAEWKGVESFLFDMPHKFRAVTRFVPDSTYLEQPLSTVGIIKYLLLLRGVDKDNDFYSNS